MIVPTPAGIKLKANGLFTDTSIPIVPVDEILTYGSVGLFDPAHSADPMQAVPSVAPGASAKVPNLAWPQAAQLIGSGTQETLAADIVIGSGTTTSSFQLGLTPKNAIQGIMSQVNNTGNSQGAYIKLRDALRDYLYSQINVPFYIGITLIRDRAAINAATGNKRSAIFGNGAANSDANSLFSLNSQQVYPTSGALGYSLTGAGLNGLGRIDFDIAVPGFGGTAPTSAANYLALMALWGSAHPTGLGGTVKNEHSSFRFCIGYIEQMAASGRSFGAIKTIMDRRRATAFGTGGRYAGDTPIDPATFP